MFISTAYADGVSSILKKETSLSAYFQSQFEKLTPYYTTNRLDCPQSRANGQARAICRLAFTRKGCEPYLRTPPCLARCAESPR